MAITNNCDVIAAADHGDVREMAVHETGGKGVGLADFGTLEFVDSDGVGMVGAMDVEWA